METNRKVEKALIFLISFVLGFIISTTIVTKQHAVKTAMVHEAGYKQGKQDGYELGVLDALDEVDKMRSQKMEKMQQSVYELEQLLNKPIDSEG